MRFTLHHTDPQSKARVGELRTDHGVIQTPVFMPVGTLGAVKTIHPRDLRDDLNAVSYTHLTLPTSDLV